MTRTATQVLVADAQPLVRLGIELLVGRTFGSAQVRVACDSDELAAQLSRPPAPRIVTIADDLPGFSAAKGVREIAARHPAIRVVVMGADPDCGDILKMLAAGARAYVPKTLPPADMCAAFRAVNAGRIYVPAGLSAVAVRPDVKPALPNIDGLTSRQRAVLTQLAAGKSNKEIGRALGISEATVKAHLNAAFRTLGVHNRVSAASLLHG
ncbi:response regulator transcription factor [uncultured Sphingomonas sp.]|uniref:LuxR C-terminal-related transcriptional regulator n=1 Tax=uncultured Sphingomonas sp. TaxID=158754 RepID=UPI0025E7D33A|nr:response regulator transcription factor [uncultured Sphingomonas sp.]